MPTKVDALLEAEADKQARIDELTENRQDIATARLTELLENPDERDFELWERFVEDPELTLSDFEAVDVFDRGPEWVAGLSAIWAAAEVQTWMEVYAVDIIEIAEEEGRAISDTTADMAREEMSEAAKQGIGKQRFEDAKRRRAG
jgi:hypothetical protein